MYLSLYRQSICLQYHLMSLPMYGMYDFQRCPYHFHQAQHSGITLALDGKTVTEQQVTDHVRNILSEHGKYSKKTDQLNKISMTYGDVSKAAETIINVINLGYDHLIPKKDQYKKMIPAVAARFLLVSPQ
jgi:hypothetical protein